MANADQHPYPSSGTWPATTSSLGLDHTVSDPAVWTLPEPTETSWVETAEKPFTTHAIGARMIGRRIGEILGPAILLATLVWLIVAGLRLLGVL